MNSTPLVCITLILLLSLVSTPCSTTSSTHSLAIQVPSLAHPNLLTWVLSTCQLASALGAVKFTLTSQINGFEKVSIYYEHLATSSIDFLNTMCRVRQQEPKFWKVLPWTKRVETRAEEEMGTSGEERSHGRRNSEPFRKEVNQLQLQRQRQSSVFPLIITGSILKFSYGDTMILDP